MYFRKGLYDFTKEGQVHHCLPYMSAIPQWMYAELHKQRMKCVNIRLGPHRIKDGMRQVAKQYVVEVTS